MFFHLFKSGLGLKTFGVLIGLSLNGCDYWPPALHHEIEELRNDLNDALDERQRVNNDNAKLRTLQESLRREAEEKERENGRLRQRVTSLETGPRPALSAPQRPESSGEAPPSPVKRGAYVALQLGHPMAQGPRVIQLQRLLRRHEFPVPIDGLYGPTTAAAVRAFQRSQGLPADGIAGPSTDRALRRTQPSIRLVRPLELQRPPVIGHDVRSLQHALRRAGHSVTVDGHYGPETRIVVTRFQRARGLEPDGVVGPETWGALVGHRR